MPEPRKFNTCYKLLVCIMHISISILKLKTEGSTFLAAQGSVYNGFERLSR